MSSELKEKRNEFIWGLVLIGIGLFALAGQTINVEWDNWGIFFLPVLGGIFWLWGILSRQAGLIIPGGIISGIGWGSVLVTWPFAGAEDVEGGVFMLAFALGWVSITVLTAVFTKQTHWWPLIPGGIMAVIGLGILFGSFFLSILAFAGNIWPLFLILLGLYVIMTANKEKKTA